MHKNMNKISDASYRNMLNKIYDEEFLSLLRAFIKNEEYQIKLGYRRDCVDGENYWGATLRLYKASLKSIEKDIEENDIDLLRNYLVGIYFNSPRLIDEKDRCPSCHGKFPMDIWIGESMFCPHCGQKVVASPRRAANDGIELPRQNVPVAEDNYDFDYDFDYDAAPEYDDYEDDDIDYEELDDELDSDNLEGLSEEEYREEARRIGRVPP